MLEKELETKLVQATKKRDGRAYKFISPGNAGVPDRLIVLPGGKIGFAELKRDEDCKPTKLQLHQITFLLKLNCLVRVINAEEQIEMFLDELEKSERRIPKLEDERTF